MDWLWPIYRHYIERIAPEGADVSELGPIFLRSLADSTATAYVMEPIGDTIRFRGLGRWPLTEVSELLADPNAFLDDRYGGGKFKVNFHHELSFVGTHNFRTYGEELLP